MILGGLFFSSPAWAESFSVSPTQAPKGSPIFLSGICKNDAGQKGEIVNVSLSRDADHAVVAGAVFRVGAGGTWRGGMVVPRTDTQGNPVDPGAYTIGADCEFGEDAEGDFSYDDQPFTVTPGEAPGGGGGATGCDPGFTSCPAGTDCVAKPSDCDASFNQAEQAAQTKEAAARPQGPAARAQAKAAQSNSGAGSPAPSPGQPAAGDNTPTILLGASEATPGAQPDSSPSAPAVRTQEKEKGAGGRSVARTAGMLTAVAILGAAGYIAFKRRRHAL